MRTFIAALFSLSTAALAQTVHEIPFASEDNIIDLAVENTASVTVKITVEVKNHPDWISFKSREATIDNLSKGEEKTASFVFSVDKKGLVNKEQKLTFVISGPNSQSWTKEITISIAPPDRFELFQNYPNPFNPTTTISYQLRADTRVSLKIYNMIGQEVTTLVDGERTAGFQQETWNASSAASGTYIYRFIAKDEWGKEIVEKKMMMLLK